MSSFVVGHVASKLLDQLAATFRTHVIERWSYRRAHEFFEEFCFQLSVTTPVKTSTALENALARLTEDETCSQVLFDAYRRVTLARSRVLGPRVIAILTAELVIQRRPATEVEDTMFSAAESLADDELIAFARFVRQQQELLSAQGGSEMTETRLRIRWHDETFDSHAARQVIATGPLDLNYALGRWAGKLRILGILTDDIQERLSQYYANPDRKLADGTLREITWWIEVPQPYFKLVELVERACLRPEMRDDFPRY